MSGIYWDMEILNFFGKAFFGMHILTCFTVLCQNASTCDVMSGSGSAMNADIP